MPAITLIDLENAKTDVDHIAAIATSTALTATDRLGHVKKTMSGASADVSASVAAVEASKNTAVNTTIPGQVAAVEASKNTAINTTIPGKMAEVEAAKNTAINTTITGKIAEVDTAKNTAINTTIPAAVALVDAAVAQTAAGSATASKIAAEAAKTAAELARDAAQLSAGVYATTADGLAATTNEKYFNVPASSANDSLILYQNSNGTAVAVKRYPSSLAIDDVNNLIKETIVPEPEIAWAVVDKYGRSAITVLSDGTVEVADLDIPNIDVTGVINSLSVNTSEINGISAEKLAQAVSRSDRTVDSVISGSAYLIVDSAGRVPFAINDDGSIAVNQLSVDTSLSSGSFSTGSAAVSGAVTASSVSAPTVSTSTLTSVASINGKPFSDFTVFDQGGGTYLAEIVYFNSAGQSLSVGINTGITTSQEYDNIGFPVNANAPASALPLTNANCGGTEGPIFGALGHIKEMIQEENNLTYQQQLFQLLGCTNGYSGVSINTLIKGQVSYTNVLSQVTAGKAIAQAENKVFMAGANFWTQGEADSANYVNMSFVQYRDKLKQLAFDYDADMRAITGQTTPVPLISYQMCSLPGNVALAQLAAANESSLVHVACAMYPFDYMDTVHLTAQSSKWLGAYYALVYKRVVVDGKEWKPIQPVSQFVQGKFANVKFDVPYKPLKIDTSLVPAQTNYGFQLVDSAGNPITISSVSVVSPDTVKIVAASNIPVGAKLRYGLNTATGRGNYTGGCGNLRDSQGDRITYSAINKPMHNWCLVFEYNL